MIKRSALFLALSTALASAAASEPPRAARVFDVDAATLNRAGVDAALARDYGSFRWIRADDATLEALAALGARVELDPRANRIQLGAFDFDPTVTQSRELTGAASRTAAGEGLALVQFDAPLTRAASAALEARGLSVIQYVPTNAVLAWGRADALDAARSVDGVRWAGDYALAFRVDADTLGTSGAVDDLEVFFYSGRGSDALLQAVRALGGSVELVGAAQPDGVFSTARISVAAGAIAAIAALPEVVKIDRVADATHDDELPNQMVANNFVAGLPVIGYLDWLQSIGLTGGEGIGWAVTDSGSDVDHPDLAPAYIGGANAPGCNTGMPGDDVGGHGSHVAGTILGRGIGDRSGPANERDPQRFVYGQGVAPRANMFPVRFIGTGCSGLLEQDRSRLPLLAGVNGSNNSWNNSNSAPRTTYGVSERLHDVMTRDGNFDTAATEPFLLVFSAGNAGGSGPGSITGPKAAKNLIVVGNSLNARGGANFNLMAGGSSRGPLSDGRLAPTLTAVGTNTASTRNAGGGSCATAIVGTNNLYSNCSGTSMSTPMVSGGAVLITEWWRQRNANQNPSPAMVKAVLVASARDLPGSAPGTNLIDGSRPIPNNDEGWGFMNLRAALAPDVAGVYRDQPTVLTAAGQVLELTVAPANPAQPMRVTLVWTDAPAAASVGAGPALVNDLDLEVVNGGTTYLGNVFANGASQAGGTRDTLNNIESVYLASPAAGATTLRVRGTAINGDALSGNGTPGSPRQDYALVCSNCVEAGFRVVSAAPFQGACGAAPAAFNFSLESVLGFAGPVTMAATGVPAGASSAFPMNPINAGSSGVLNVQRGSAASGRYALTLTGNGTPGARQIPLRLELAASAPIAAAPALPVNAAVNVDALPTLTWLPGAEALRHRVDVATDSGFANIVATREVSASSVTLDVPLASGTEYFWRVVARNPCGDASPSPTRSFTTAARVCSSAALVIPDGSTTGVTGVLPTSGGGNLARLAVSVEAIHPRVGDLRLVLRHVPSGTSARLFTRPNECNLANVNARFEMRASEFVQCFAGANAISGLLIPQDPLSVFNGLDFAGPWQLTAADEVAGSTGEITRWCIEPAFDADVVFSSGFEAGAP